jgi:hypothetical protein
LWTAECKEVGTATFGETFEKAKANIKEAVDLHLNMLEDVRGMHGFAKEKRNIFLFVISHKLRENILQPTICQFW